MPAPFDIPVDIAKHDIAEYARYHGAVNSAAFRGREPRTLKFVTFFGKVDVASGKYTGVYRFEVGSYPDDTPADLNQLPGLNGGESDGV